jgi:hypothetical protein
VFCLSDRIPEYLPVDLGTAPDKIEMLIQAIEYAALGR